MPSENERMINPFQKLDCRNTTIVSGIPVLAKTALPAGYRIFNSGYFNNVGNNAYFWSASENNSNNAWNRKLNYNNSEVNRNNNNKQNGFAVRLLRELKQSDSPLHGTCHVHQNIAGVCDGCRRIRQ